MAKPFVRKRIIELYFVLYLMALILILPKKGEKHIGTDETSTVYQLPFSLKPINTVLNARILATSDTLKILNLDSLNLIYYTGKIKDIDFEFVIKDVTSNQKLTLSESKPKVKLFSIYKDKKRQAAVFKWTPAYNDYRDKTYLVSVKAIITPSDKSFENEKVSINTEFSINIDYITNFDLADLKSPIDTMPTDIYRSRVITEFNNSGKVSNSGDFTIYPGKEIITTLAGENWSNQLIISGIDLQSELKTPPLLSIDHSSPNNGGWAKYTITKDNSLIIEGEAPDFGSNRIKITLNRYDGKKAETEFSIFLDDIGNPQISKIMYPEMSYTINPQLPSLTSLNAISILKNSRGDELQRYVGGKKFTYTPSRRDTNIEILLERYVNNRLYDVTKSRILPNPPPKIIYLTKENEKEVRLVTYSSGIYNGRENVITKVMIEGNADYYSRAGMYNEDRKGGYEQSYVITWSDRSKPFRFKVTVENAEGKRSETKSWLGK